jgi:uncharacterized protein (TIGR02722 family)
MKIQFMPLLMIGCLLVVGCRTPVIQHVDSSDPLVTLRLDPYEVSNTVEFMVDSMLSFPAVIEMTRNERPVLGLGDLRNRTSQRIDVRLINQNMRTRLIRSGQFRFVDYDEMPRDVDQWNIEDEIGLVDASRTVARSAQSAEQLYLYGDILEMRDESPRRQYYQIQLNLRDRRSGEIVWSDIREVHRARRL